MLVLLSIGLDFCTQSGKSSVSADLVQKQNFIFYTLLTIFVFSHVLLWICRFEVLVIGDGGAKFGQRTLTALSTPKKRMGYLPDPCVQSRGPSKDPLYGSIHL